MKLLLLTGGLLLLLPPVAQACRVCRPRVQATIHGPDYTQHLAVLLLPVAVLVLVGLGVFFAADIRAYFHRLRATHD
ncbi:hypothetical protein [Hymenobacter guriensis]|uniref:Uncharacterized protein n=1 Tax=Hymenobacter guriensis TaxID=2793065 RepID=A0ABS0L258_9BACT|nr:hypothetical protein [Hymenobacter guriensis]MBG8554163.1 hypothetical protein [Hymenobacter guriensis]